MKKLPALNNSFFKQSNDTVLEIAKYYTETGNLPFRYDGENWVYDAFIERQKRRGVQNSQFLTPDNTAKRMAELAYSFRAAEFKAIDACCGTGQLTKALLNIGFEVMGFDNDKDMVELCSLLYPKAKSSFKEMNYDNFNVSMLGQLKSNLIVSNPPYENLVVFFAFLSNNLALGGYAVLLLPKGTVDKTKPKLLVEYLQNFEVVHREDMQEEFARTKVGAEIVVLHNYIF
jgi:SAM-dependent methyltransferase